MISSNARLAARCPSPHRLRTSSAARRRLTIAVLAGLSGLGLQLSAAAQPLVGCGWREAPLRLAYPETNAHYYQADVPLLPPPGSRLRIEGEYLPTRYFSFQVYDAQYAPIDEISDYLVTPDAGSLSTLLGPTASNPAVAPGGRYTAYVNYGKLPTVRRRNTVYTGAPVTALTRFQLTLRTYLEESPVKLPRLVLETPTGDLPVTPYPCRLQTTNSTLAESQLAAPAQEAATPPANPRDVPFAVFYGAENGDSEFGLNQNAAYMSATVTRRKDIIVIRGRAPTFRDRAATRPARPELRYWSFCQNDLRLTTVVACLADRDIPVDANGIYHLVVADGAAERLPKSAGFAAMPFGQVLFGQGFLIYRQLLAADGFAGAIATVPRGVAPQSVIGDYTPTAVYCPPALFEARVRARDTPEQVFAACAAAPS